MKNFDFLKPQTVEEACSLLLEFKEEAKLIAGGQSIIPLMRHRIIS
ncbi:MAG: FAD binding domain-containing protein, partial [Candidatus Bathyarchaeia archaeon]